MLHLLVPFWFWKMHRAATTGGPVRESRAFGQTSPLSNSAPVTPTVGAREGCAVGACNGCEVKKSNERLLMCARRAVPDEPGCEASTKFENVT
jgi:hypothetical protein